MQANPSSIYQPEKTPWTSLNARIAIPGHRAVLSVGSVLNAIPSVTVNQEARPMSPRSSKGIGEHLRVGIEGVCSHTNPPRCEHHDCGQCLICSRGLSGLDHTKCLEHGEMAPSRRRRRSKKNNLVQTATGGWLGLSVPCRPSAAD